MRNTLIKHGYIRGWGNGKSLTSVLGVISVADFAIATVDTAPVATDS